MTSSILSTLLPFAISIVGWFLDKATTDKTVQENFLKFISSLEEKQIISGKLRLSYEEQLKKLKDETK